MSLKIFTCFSSSWCPIGNFTTPHNANYAIMHGYDFRCDIIPDVSPNRPHPAWHKIFAAREWIKFGDYRPKEWFLIADADAVFTTKEPILPVLQETAARGDFGFDGGIIGCSDVNAKLNTGVWAFTKTRPVARFLDEVWSLRTKYERHHWYENAATEELLSRNPLPVNLAIVPQGVLNQYSWQWKPGDATAHHPGGNLQEKIDSLQNIIKTCTSG